MAGGYFAADTTSLRGHDLLHYHTWLWRPSVTGNEGQVAETQDGVLVLNLRANPFGENFRLISKSKDGGSTWCSSWPLPKLPPLSAVRPPSRRIARQSQHSSSC
eukprot:scaffold170790_cov31-Tisochrysis_lutea.AAC.3